MEDIVAVYPRPYDPKRPLVCRDEVSKVLHSTPSGVIPRQPGASARQDYEYQRHGTANLFLSIDPLRSRRQVCVTHQRTAQDFAEILRALVDEDYPAADTIVLVVDRCGFWGIFWRIIVPLSAPAMGVVAIFQFTYDWNNFFDPLIYINSPKYFPVALGLRMLQGTLVQVPVQQIMAMTLVSIIPVLGDDKDDQRSFIQGIVVTGVKG
jgi:hypothetical protein